MLLLDFSSVVVTAAMNVLYKQPDELSMTLMRSVGLSEILHLKRRYFRQYGQPVLCCDGGKYWRRDVFEYFKENRKQAKDSAPVDWDLFYDYFGEFKRELAESFPYVIVNIEKLEADDVVAVLTESIQRPTMIVSSDKDMLQLQAHYGSRVSQYSPQAQKLLDIRGHGYDLLTHVLRGDSGDGIPNVLSDDDTLVTPGKRQKPIKKTLIEDVRKHGAEDVLDPKALAKYQRNRNLIDTRYIPTWVKDAIIAEYTRQMNTPKKPRVYTYLKEHKLRLLMRNQDQF